MATKEEWLVALRVAESYDRLTLSKPELKAPQFEFGRWTGAVEQERAFKSVVLRFDGKFDGPRPSRWRDTPSKQKEVKNWQFRVDCKPQKIKELLDEMAAAGW